MSLRDFLLLLALGAIWGVSFLFIKVAVPELGPIALMGGRIIVAALALTPFIVRSKNKRELLARKWDLLVMGLFNLALPFFFIAYASLRIEAGFTSLLNSTTPLFAALLGAIWLKQGIGVRKAMGILLGFGGIAALFGDRMSFGASGVGLSILSALMGALCYAFSSNYHKKRLSHLPPVEATAGSLLWPALLVLPLLAFYWPPTVPSLKAISAVFLLAVLGTSFALYLYFGILNRVGVIAATSVTYLIPIFAILWASLFLKEPLTMRLFLGMPLVFAGTALTLELKKPKPQK